MNDDIEYMKPLHVAAGYAAPFIGGLWACSFLCHMYGLGTEWLGHVGNFLAILSMWMMTNTIANYRRLICNIGLGGCLKMAACICIFSSLITGLVQFIYFAFLDGGRLMGIMATMMEQPEFEQMLSEMNLGIDAATMAEELQKMTVKDAVVQMMMMNLMLSLPITLLTAVFARIARVPEKKQ